MRKSVRRVDETTKDAEVAMRWGVRGHSPTMAFVNWPRALSVIAKAKKAKRQPTIRTVVATHATIQKGSGGW